MGEWKWLENLPQEVWYFVIAAVGGAAKACHDYLTNETFSLRRTLVQMFISSFSGYMMALALRSFGGVEGEGLLLAAGLGGWMGINGLEVISRVLMKVTSK